MIGSVAGVRFKTYLRTFTGTIFAASASCGTRERRARLGVSDKFHASKMKLQSSSADWKTVEIASANFVVRSSFSLPSVAFVPSLSGEHFIDKTHAVINIAASMPRLVGNHFTVNAKLVPDMEVDYFD